MARYTRRASSTKVPRGERYQLPEFGSDQEEQGEGREGSGNSQPLLQVHIRMVPSRV
jgi:hypothetical protein